MATGQREALHVVHTVKKAGRIYEDAQNHVWYVPTGHPIFSAIAMVAGPVSRQIEAGLLSTGIDRTRRYAEVSPEGAALLERECDSAHITDLDRWLVELLPEEEGLAV